MNYIVLCERFLLSKRYSISIWFNPETGYFRELKYILNYFEKIENRNIYRKIDSYELLK